MPGLVGGMLRGFSGALEEHQTGEAKKQETQRGLQMGVLNSLLGSDNKQLQRLAVSALSELATKPGKRAKGLQGFLGGQEESTALDPIMELLQQMDDGGGGGGAGGGSGAPPPPSAVDPSGRYIGQPLGTANRGAPAAMPAESLVEGRQTTPPAIFTSEREQQRGMRADVRQEEEAARQAQIQQLIEAGVSEDEIRNYMLGGRPGTSSGPAVKSQIYTDAEGNQQVVDLNQSVGRNLGPKQTTPPPLRSPDMEVFGDRKKRWDPTNQTWIDEGPAPTRSPGQPIRRGAAINAQETIKNIAAEVERLMGPAFGLGGPEVEAAMEAAANRRETTMAALTQEAEQEYGTGLAAPPAPAAAPVGGRDLMSPPMGPGGGISPPPGAQGGPPELSPVQEAILLKIQNDEPLTPEEIEEFKKMVAAQSGQ